MDPLAQPTCPTCRTVMRDTATGFVCGGCGFSVVVPVVAQPVFDGPSIHGG